MFLRTIKILVPLVGPMHKQLAISVLLHFIIMGLELIQPYVIKRLIDHVFVYQDTTELFWCFLFLAGVPIISEVFKSIRRKSDQKIERAVTSSLQIKVYSHVQQLHIRFFVESSPAEVVTRITSDIRAVYTLCVSLIRNLTDVFRFGIMLVTLLSLEWRLTLISFATFPFSYYLLVKLALKAREKAKKSATANDLVNTRLTEHLSIEAILLTKIFGREKHNVEKLKDDINVEMDATGEDFLFMYLLYFFVNYSAEFNTALVYYFGGKFLFSTSISLGGLIFFTQSLHLVYSPLSEILTARISYIKSAIQIQRVFELLQLPIEIKDPVEPVTLTDEGSLVKGDIELENVSLDYSMLPTLKIAAAERLWSKNNSESNNSATPRRRDWALNNLSVSFKAGTMNAIVGRSGAGKSTLLKLIHRLLDPTQGLIKLDGVDIRKLKLEELVGYMGVVSQDSFFFNDTIRNNLSFARPNATDDEIERACRAANVWELIESFANKLDEKVGESGYKLSGGERQRLSIARTILRNPKIILLDEATSSLDSENENLIKNAMDELFKNRTSVVIAHRLSTIVDATQIIVMDNGSVVECGTHKDLIAMNGHYKALYDAQYSKQNK
jgi:ATP-binding cassette subfamily B protein